MTADFRRIAEYKLFSVKQTTAREVDLVLFVIDIHEKVDEKDLDLLKKYTDKGFDIILALTKTDIMPESLLIAELKELSSEGLEVVPVSARKNKNIKELFIFSSIVFKCF